MVTILYHLPLLFLFLPSTHNLLSSSPHLLIALFLHVQKCISSFKVPFSLCSAVDAFAVKKSISAALVTVRGVPPVQLTTAQLRALARHFHTRVLYTCVVCWHLTHVCCCLLMFVRSNIITMIMIFAMIHTVLYTAGQSWVQAPSLVLQAQALANTIRSASALFQSFAKFYLSVNQALQKHSKHHNTSTFILVETKC